MAPHQAERKTMSRLTSSDLGEPFKPLLVEFTEEDMRELAYEIIVAACGPAVSARTTSVVTRTTSVASPRYQDHRLLASSAASRVKKALGLKSRSSKDLYNATPHGSRRKTATPADIIRMQLGISEEVDSRTRKALSRAAASQVGRRVESMLVPLELLQNISISDFAYTAEYQLWHARQVKVLEAGLVSHPAIHDVANSITMRLKQALKSVTEHPMETGKNSEVLQALRTCAMAKAGRTLAGQATTYECHWADGVPFNVHIYITMLSSCFDTVDSTIVIDELDDVLDLLRKTWGILGINQVIHDVLFMWVLFRQFVLTGRPEVELLEASANQMSVVAKVVPKTKLEDQHVHLVSSILNTTQAWCEKRLLAYRESFPTGAAGLMEHMLAVAISAAQVLHDESFRDTSSRRRKDETDIAMSRIDVYIRSTLRTSFAQLMESVDAKRRSLKGDGQARPALVVLAEDTENLAISERDSFSPILKIWHPFPTGVAAATLHACYGREFKQFLSGTTFPTPDTVQVLSAADHLEKELIPIAVEDALFSDDGGKAVIREMPPYEADTAIKSMAQKWIEERLERLGEWVSRSAKQEDWKPTAVRERYARSAVEVLRIVEETLDAYFSMPLAQFPDLLEELVTGVDRSLATYSTQAISGCGTKNDMVPALPPLTRCRNEHFRLSVKFGTRKSKGRADSNGTSDRIEVDGTLECMCVRINTLHHLQSELEFIEKRVRYGWQEVPSKFRKDGKASAPLPKTGIEVKFEATRSSLQEGIEQLCELTAYRTVFVDMNKAMWEGLYVGGVESSRMNRVIDTLDPVLGVIADTVTKPLRNKAVVALMRACFEGLMLVLLAGGPSRSFTVTDADMLEEDLTALKDLFKADGDGLSEDIVENTALPIARILSLFSVDTDEVIANFKAANTRNGQQKASKSTPPPLPSTISQWNPSDPNTLLRILCYRADDRASKFLKKTYNLPKRL